MRLPRCVLFDLDGTLLDSIPGIAYSVGAAMRAAGLPEREGDLCRELRRWIGPPIRIILSKVAETEDAALLDRLERAFRASYDGEGWRQTICFPGAPELLATLKRNGHRLFVVSNKPRDISVKILDALGIAGYFERMYMRDSREPAYASKAEMLGAVLAGHGLRPEDCVMVGDTMEDAGAAARQAIGFLFMEHGYGELTREEPVLLKLGSFSEFMPYLAVEKVQ